MQRTMSVVNTVPDNPEPPTYDVAKCRRILEDRCRKAAYALKRKAYKLEQRNEKLRGLWALHACYGRVQKWDTTTPSHIAVLRTDTLDLATCIYDVTLLPLTPKERRLVDADLAIIMRQFDNVKRVNSIFFTDVDLLMYGTRINDAQRRLAVFTLVAHEKEERMLAALLRRAQHRAVYAHRGQCE